MERKRKKGDRGEKRSSSTIKVNGAGSNKRQHLKCQWAGGTYRRRGDFIFVVSEHNRRMCSIACALGINVLPGRRRRHDWRATDGRCWRRLASGGRCFGTDI